MFKRGDLALVPAAAPLPKFRQRLGRFFCAYGVHVCHSMYIRLECVERSCIGEGNETLTGVACEDALRRCGAGRFTLSGRSLAIGTTTFGDLRPGDLHVGQPRDEPH